MAKVKQNITSARKPIRKRAVMLPVQKEMCATCPFRPGSPYAYLAAKLTESALSECSRVCHSTGSNNGINHRTGKPPMLCRGARDMQIRHLHAIGFLEEPTDKCWANKVREMGLA